MTNATTTPEVSSIGGFFNRLFRPQREATRLTKKLASAHRSIQSLENALKFTRRQTGRRVKATHALLDALHEIQEGTASNGSSKRMKRIATEALEAYKSQHPFDTPPADQEPQNAEPKT
jgi:hypothetical protein